MAEFETEEQRVEAIKKWWADNGRQIIAGVALGIAALVGWRGWTSYQNAQAASASEHYHTMRQALAKDDTDAVQASATSLRESFGSTPYAALAALDLAKLKAQAGELGEAERQLRWAADNAAQPEVAAVARLRLAGVLTAAGKPGEALEVLDQEFPPPYTSLLEERRGDARRAQGDIEAARSAYNRALESAGGGRNEYLRMKRDDLGVPAESTS